VERLLEFIQQADDFAVARIKPYELADSWQQGAPSCAGNLSAATASRALLDLQWDSV